MQEIIKVKRLYMDSKAEDEEISDFKIVEIITKNKEKPA